MRTFLVKLAAFLVLQGLVATVLLWRYDTSAETNFLAATAAKHRRLAKTLPPRLIITGGSNVPFGIQSDRLEEALNIRVVNMGLAAGLGLDFMLAEVQPSLRGGDRVLISLEYDQFSGGFDPDIIQQVLVFRPASVRFLQAKHFRKVIVDRGLILAGAIARRAVASLSPTDCDRSVGMVPESHGYNAWGDFRAHYGKGSLLPPEPPGSLLPPRREWPSPSARRALTQFSAHCHQRGIKVVFSFPPQQPERLQNDRAAVDQIVSALESIPYLTILDSPARQSYPAELFFDTGYHLNAAGAALRTERILERLQPH